MKKMIALDLGSDSTRVYMTSHVSMHNGGIVYNEKSAVAFTPDRKKAVAAGNAAIAADSRIPGALRLIRPLRGYKSDSDALLAMLRHVFDEIDTGNIFSKPAVVFAMPRGSSIEACSALCDTILRAGASEVACIDAPLAAAHGAGLDVEGSSAFMILLLGEEISEAAVICRGAVLSSCTIGVTGKILRSTLDAYIKKKLHIACSEAELTRIIYGAGGIHPSAPQTTCEVTGKDILTGLPLTASLSTANINEAFLPCAGELIRAVLALLGECPDEITGEICKNGITLCGGVSLLSGISELVAELTGIRASTAGAPAECVVEGIGDLIEMPDYPFNFVKN